MATCNITIKAKDGESSFLFKELLNVSNNPANAIDQYFYTRTEEFKREFGDWEAPGFDKSKLDARGEPLFSAISDEAWHFDTDFANINLEEGAAIYKKVLDVAPVLIDTLETKLKQLKGLRKGTAILAIKQVESLLETLKTEDLATGIPKVLASSSKYLARLKERALNSAKSGTDIRKLAGIHKDAQSYRIVGDLQNQLLGTLEASEIFSEDLFGSISSVMGDMLAIENVYMEVAKKHLVEAFHSQDSSWSKKSIRDWLDHAPRDTKKTEMALEYLGDSHDRVLSATAKAVKNVQNDVRVASIEFNKRLEVAQIALEKESGTNNAEKMYGDIIYKGKDGSLKYLNPNMEATDSRFAQLEKVRTSKPALYDFLVLYSDTMQELTAMTGAKLEGSLPIVLKAGRERIQGQNLKDRYKQLADDSKKSFLKSNQDLEKGEVTNGVYQAKVPVYYTNKYDSVDYESFYKDKYKELIEGGLTDIAADEQADTYATFKATEKNAEFVSKDLAYSLQSFHAMGTNYAQMDAVIDTLDAAKAVVGSNQRTYTLVDSGGKRIMRKIRGADGKALPETIGGPESNSYKALESFLEAQVYGQTEAYKGTFKIGKHTIDTAKVLRKLNSGTSWVQMSMNVLASAANVGNGEYNNVMESMGGEYFNTKDYRAGSKFYAQHLSGVLSDFAERTPKSLLGNIIEHYDTMQDFQAKGTIKGTEGTAARRLIKWDLAFFLQNAGEHFMQTRAALAVFNNTKTFNKDGTEAGTLLSAHSVKNGSLVIQDVYVKGKDGELAKFDRAEQNRVTNRAQAIIRKLHGNYNKQTANLMKRDARTALLLKYRDWAYEGIVRRYGKKQYYDSLEQDVEGFYRTGARVLGAQAKAISKLQLSLVKENWANLTEHERANVRRAVMEIAALTALSIAGALMAHAGKMVEEEYDGDSFGDMAARGTFAFMNYEVNRLFTELAAYSSIGEALRLMQTPAASTSILEGSYKLLVQAFNPTEVYESGWRKGQSKLGRRVEALTPIYKNLNTIFNKEGIEEKGIFYEI